MEDGALSGEPEVELARGEKRKKASMPGNVESKGMFDAPLPDKNTKTGSNSGITGDEFFEQSDGGSDESAEEEEDEDKED